MTQDLERVLDLIGLADYHLQALHGGMIIVRDKGTWGKGDETSWVNEGTEGMEKLREAANLLVRVISDKPMPESVIESKRRKAMKVATETIEAAGKYQPGLWKALSGGCPEQQTVPDSVHDKCVGIISAAIPCDSFTAACAVTRLHAEGLLSVSVQQSGDVAHRLGRLAAHLEALDSGSGDARLLREAIALLNMTESPVRKQVACPAGCDDGVDWSSGEAKACDECEGSGTLYVTTNASESPVFCDRCAEEIEQANAGQSEISDTAPPLSAHVAEAAAKAEGRFIAPTLQPNDLTECPTCGIVKEEYRVLRTAAELQVAMKRHNEDHAGDAPTRKDGGRDGSEPAPSSSPAPALDYDPKTEQRLELTTIQQTTDRVLDSLGHKPGDWHTGQPVELPHSVRSELLALRAKAKSSLSNNLCPDHRDKQHDKPCLACTIERLERKVTEREAICLTDTETCEAIQIMADCMRPPDEPGFHYSTYEESAAQALTGFLNWYRGVIENRRWG